MNAYQDLNAALCQKRKVRKALFKQTNVAKFVALVKDGSLGKDE
jgi:hypothetical protein